MVFILLFVYLFNESYEFKCFLVVIVRGEGFLNINYNFVWGIDLGISFCWCNYVGECFCFRFLFFLKVIFIFYIMLKVEKKFLVRVRNLEIMIGRLDFFDYLFILKGI